MQAHFEIDTIASTVHVCIEGRIDGAALLALFRRYLAHPDSGPGQSSLIDLSGATRFDLDFRAINLLVTRMHRLFAPQGDTDLRHAIFAPTDIGYGIARMYQSIGADVLPARVGVFRNLDTARAFLAGETVLA